MITKIYAIKKTQQRAIKDFENEFNKEIDEYLMGACKAWIKKQIQVAYKARIKLPERKEYCPECMQIGSCCAKCYGTEAWNNCLDEIEKLNL